MALCEGSTLKLKLLALKLLPLLVLPKPSMHTKFQLLAPSLLPCRNPQSFLQKLNFEAHLSPKPSLAYPGMQIS